MRIFFRIITRISVVLILFSLIICVFIGIKRLDYFRIKNIVVKEGRVLDFVYLKDRNIFSVDLAKESSDILRRHPYYKKVRLIRILPNMLFAECIKRRSIACLKLNRDFYVDEDCVLYDTLPKKDNHDLPFIFGLEKKISNPKSFRKYDLPELVCALNILREMEKTLHDWQVEKIDFVNSGTISFFIFPQQASSSGDAGLYNRGGEDKVEVKIGPDDIAAKIGILTQLLGQKNNPLDKIKYIDLRFRDPVLKFTSDR